MSIFSHLCITDEDALEAGLTYKASLYGVDVYCGSPDGECIEVANKCQLTCLWTIFIDFLVDLMLFLLPNHMGFKFPLKNIRLIKG